MFNIHLHRLNTVRILGKGAIFFKNSFAFFAPRSKVMKSHAKSKIKKRFPEAFIMFIIGFLNKIQLPLNYLFGRSIFSILLASADPKTLNISQGCFYTSVTRLSIWILTLIVTN